MPTNVEKLYDAVADYGTERRLGGTDVAVGVEAHVAPAFAVHVRVNGEIVASGHGKYLDDAFGVALRVFLAWREDNDRLAGLLEASLEQVQGTRVANVNGGCHVLPH